MQKDGGFDTTYLQAATETLNMVQTIDQMFLAGIGNSLGVHPYVEYK